MSLMRLVGSLDKLALTATATFVEYIASSFELPFDGLCRHKRLHQRHDLYRVAGSQVGASTQALTTDDSELRGGFEL